MRISDWSSDVCSSDLKLTSLAGFILVPFAFWNRTSFLAERVLGNVVSSGIKVMVLAVIVGIGSNYFTQFTTALQGQEPDIGQAMSLVQIGRAHVRTPVTHAHPVCHLPLEHTHHT